MSKIINFNMNLGIVCKRSMRDYLISNVYQHAYEVFEIEQNKKDDLKILNILLRVFSKNLVSLYLNAFNELNNIADDENLAFDTTWEHSSVSIAIDDIAEIQKSMNEKFSDLFMKIEHQLFSIKQISPYGELVNLVFNLKKDNLDFKDKYNSLKYGICYYLK